LGKWQDA
jgi:protein transport protein SEC61 subunit alpha